MINSSNQIELRVKNEPNDEPRDNIVESTLNSMKNFVKTTTFIYFAILFLFSIIGLACASNSLYAFTTARFVAFYHTTLIISVLIDCFLRASNLQGKLFEPLRSSLFLIGITFTGTVVAYISGAFMLSYFAIGAYMASGAFTILCGAMLNIPLIFYIKAHLQNGYCVVTGFPI